MVNLKNEVNSPPVTWKRLDGYELKYLERDFKIADFERRPSLRHINKMVESMLIGEFYDNILRVVKKDKIHVVIDAQRRTQALKILRDKYGVKRYDLMLAIYPAEFARKIYRKLNVGKRLGANDHTLAIDNGKIPFFNELRTLAYHYRSTDRMAFIDILYAYNYAITGSSEGAIEKLDKIISQLKPNHIFIMKKFLSALKTEYPVVPGQPLYRMAIFRPCLKIGIEKELSSKEFSKMFEKILKSPSIVEISTGRRNFIVQQIYNFIKNEVFEK